MLFVIIKLSHYLYKQWLIIFLLVENIDKHIEKYYPLFKTVCSILVYFPSSFFSKHFVNVQVVQLCRTDKATTMKNFCFIRDFGFLYGFEQILEAASHKTAVVQQLTNHPGKTSKTWWAPRENSKVIFSYGLLHMDTLVLAKLQKLMFINSVQTLDAV